MKIIIKLISLVLALLVGEAMAATCTSKASGNWNSSGTWNCTSGSTPGSADTVILASPYTVSLNNNNRTAASLTINTGATLNDDNQDLTITGNVVNNGSFGTNGGALIMTGANATLSGSGTFNDTDVQIDASGISLPVGSSLNFTNQAQVRVGRDNPGTFAINGSIMGTGLSSGDRILRVYQNSSVTIDGAINAPNAYIRVEQNASVTNNGTVSVQYLDSDGNNTTSVWTQGANSSLTLSQTPSSKWSGTLNASATDNTVTYNGTATPLTPSANTYYNLVATSCGSYIILGTCTGSSGGAICIPTTVSGVASPLIAGVGDLQLGANGTVNGTSIVVSGNTSLPVTGTTSASSAGALPALSPATFPSVGSGTLNTSGTVAAGSYGTINASGNPTVFSGGTYYIDTLKATGSIQLAAGTYYINTLELSANLAVTGVVQLFIGNKVELKNNGLSLNSGGNAGNLQVNLYNNAKIDANKDNISFTGLIYSPFANSEVKFDDNATITGAIITAGKIAFDKNATFNYDATVQSQIASLACPVSGANHLRIKHDGEGSNCATENVTIEACADAACSTLTTSGGITATLQPFGSAVSIDAGGSTTVTVSPSTTGAITLAATAISPAPASAVTCLNTVTGAASCSMAVSGCSAGFECLETGLPYPAARRPLYTKLAGVGFSFDVVALNSLSAVESNYVASGGTAKNVIVELFDDSTPASCSAYASPVASQTLSFGSADAGRKTTANFNPPNAYAKLRCRVTDANAPSTVYGCSSDDFSVRPQSFTVVSATANADSTGLGTTAVPAIKAGANFSLTTTALAGYDGTPKIDATAVAVNAGTVGNIGGAFGAADVLNGVASGSAFTYSEAGYFLLNIDGVYDDTFTVVDAGGDCTPGFSNNLASGMYGCKFGNTLATSYFGRFIPDHFDTVISGGMPCPTGLACPTQFNGFVYSGQPFTTEVTAFNLAGTKTANYDGTLGYAKNMTLSAWNAVGGATANPGGGTLSSNTLLPSAFTSGIATTTTLLYKFPTTPVAPTDIYVRADEPIGLDGVSSLRGASSVEGGIKIVSGRVDISNAYGSELLDLPMTATAQYYSGASWLTSATDSVTNLTLGLFNYQSKSGGAWTTTPTPASGSISAGILSFTLSKPTGGGTGSVDVNISSPSYLLAGSNVAAVNPSNNARATFGIYKGNSKFIYIRELY